VPYFKGLLKCKSCNFITTDLDIDASDIQKIYGEKYFFGNEYVDYIKDKEILQSNFRTRLKSILEYKNDGLLVEVGCAYGFFLDLAKQYFEVKGYEICKDAVDYAKGLSLDVESGDFLKANIPESSVDVITMWDLIEHLVEPQKYVALAKNILKHDGLLCITTGDISSLNARLRREKWRMIHPPTHLHYFSRDTLKLLLEKNGFKIVHEEYIGMTRSLRQIAYSILMLGQKKHTKLFNILESLKLSDLKFSLNLRDIIFVIAKNKKA
jgi:2-polyprenyl-3-methyl-5-hydroxy-6-metoxy-1,4-benzoquinol methylase